MDKDIAPELIGKVNRDFDNNLKNDRAASALSDKLAAGQAKYEDAYKYAESIGNARAKAFSAQISSDVLPEGKMHYNIASRLMQDSLTADHDMVAEYAAGVQKSYNGKAGIGLKALKADVDEDRIDGFVQRLASEDVFDDVKWILQEPVVTHARSVVDDTIKKNAEFQHKAGVKATVTRKAAPRCCDWCTDLEGDYTYPNVPREVFQRHDHCKCTVDYEGKRLQAYNSGGKAHTFRASDEEKRESGATSRRSSEERKDWHEYKTKQEYVNRFANKSERLAKANKIEQIDNKRQILSPQITNLRSEFVGRSVGAKLQNYDIMNLQTGEMYHLAEGSRLQDKEVFAGKGTKTPYGGAWKYAQKYGGKAEDWQHVKASGVLTTPDGDRKAEIHWSQCEGIGKREMFVKKWLE